MINPVVVNADVVTVPVKVGDALAAFKSTYDLFVNCVDDVGAIVDVGKFVLYAFVPVHVLVPDKIPVPA